MRISWLVFITGILLQDPAVGKDRLLQGEMLNMGESIYSPNGQYRLTMQTDGSLAMYRVFDGSLRRGMEKYGSFSIMQHDGNFVEYKNTTPLTPIWASNTPGCISCWLQIWNDGNLSVGRNGVPWIDYAAWEIGADPDYKDAGPATTSVGMQALSPPGIAPLLIPNYPVQQQYFFIR